MAGPKKRHSIRLGADESRRLASILQANPVYCAICGAHALWSVNVSAAATAQRMPGPSTDRFEPRCSEHNGLPQGTVFHFGSGQPQESA